MVERSSSYPRIHLSQLRRLTCFQSWYSDPKKLGITIESFHRGPTPSVTFRFSITDELYGVRNTIHGGLTGALIDDLSTVLSGAVSQPGLFSQIGASKNLNSTFIRPVSLGEEVRVVCELKYVGKKRVLMRGRLYKIDTDELCVITENDRANTDPQVRAKM